MNAPICPNCKAPCSPSGGVITEKKEDFASFFTCFNCGYKVDDIASSAFEILKEFDENENNKLRRKARLIKAYYRFDDKIKT